MNRVPPSRMECHTPTMSVDELFAQRDDVGVPEHVIVPHAVYDEIERRVRRDRAALTAAVWVIHEWHNLRERANPLLEEAWRIYWRHAPEMAPIREALRGLNLDKQVTR